MNHKLDNKTGNMGDENLARLRQLKDKLISDRQATVVARLANHLDKKFEAYLENEEEFPEVASILRTQFKERRRLGNEFYLKCAEEIVANGFFTEDEDGGFHLRRVDDDQVVIKAR